MIGIVILNYNTPNDVIECVDSIIKGTHSKYIIYIVDNCSSDDSYDLLLKKYKDDSSIKVISSDYNGGYSYGNNVGIKVAYNDACDYILITNPDVVYYDKAIDIMLETLMNYENVAIVGPSTPSLDQKESQLLRKVYKSSVYFFSKKPFIYLSKIIKKFKTEYEYPTEYDSPFLFQGMVRGCSFLIDSKLFYKIGGFDDNVFLYSEEWILAKKINDIGLLCAFEPRAKALHKEATSTQRVGSGFQSFHLYLSAFYYLKYYSGCGVCYLLFAYMQNIISYFLKSVMDGTYRKLLRSFIVAQTELLLGIKKRIGYNCMR